MNASDSVLDRLRRLPRLRLAHLPTPVEALPRLGTRHGGARIWVKRDDLTGLGLGGNKVRKLELLVAEAQAHASKTLLTVGAIQSNHCRQTAAAAARVGMSCVLVLAGDPPGVPSGNVILDRLLGAEIVWTEGRDRESVYQQTYDRLWQEGRRPYRIPLGGSNPLGACAYALAISEFLAQGVEVDRIVFATSSGGTQAGLIAGAAAAGFTGEILGISVDLRSAELQIKVAALVEGIGELIGSSFRIQPDLVRVTDKYCRAGYAVLGDLEREGIREFARTEGLILDPVYTGRAAGGLLDLLRTGQLDSSGRTLFWHTGGTPALFAYAGEL